MNYKQDLFLKKININLEKHWHWWLLLTVNTALLPLEFLWAMFMVTPRRFCEGEFHCRMSDFYYAGLTTIIGTIFIAFVAWVLSFIIWPRWCRVYYQRIVIISYLLFVVWVLRTVWVNPLPSDEAYIQHFNEHREDFEKIVDFYSHLEYETRKNGRLQLKKEPREPYPWASRSYVKPLLERASITSVTGNGPNGLGEKGRINIRFSLDGQGGPFYPHWHTSLRFGVRPIYKNLYYSSTPESYTDDNFFIQKDGKFFRRKEGKRSQHRVMDSLNGYPPEHWQEGASISREFEPGWRLSMGMSY